MKALLINGYETYEGVRENRLNRSLVEYTKEILESKGYEVKVTNVEKGYDVKDEHDKTLWADVIFVQTPIYWFSAPAKFKEYIDKVYIMGYALGTMSKGDGRTRSDPTKSYGEGGLLTDKKYMLSTTWNAPQQAFEKGNKFYEGMNTDQALVALHKTYQFLGIEKLPSFSIYDVFKEADREQDIVNFKKHIEDNF
mgnify:CR=1 FL=1